MYWTGVLSKGVKSQTGYLFRIWPKVRKNCLSELKEGRQSTHLRQITHLVKGLPFIRKSQLTVLSSMLKDVSFSVLHLYSLYFKLGQGFR